MKTPSVKSMTDAFRDLTPAQAGLIKRIARATPSGPCSAPGGPDDGARLHDLLYAECPEALRSGGQLENIRWCNVGWLRAYALRAMNIILGTHGVECLTREQESDCFTLGPAYEYLNTGDAYAATLVYHRDSDAIRIGSWGDIAENESFR